MNIKEIEAELNRITERNRRVDIDKAWERSKSRRVLLMLCTYVTIGLYMSVIHVPDAWLNAVIPTTGFLLSTLSLSFLKEHWVKRRLHKQA